MPTEIAPRWPPPGFPTRRLPPGLGRRRDVTARWLRDLTPPREGLFARPVGDQ